MACEHSCAYGFDMKTNRHCDSCSNYSCIDGFLTYSSGTRKHSHQQVPCLRSCIRHVWCRGPSYRKRFVIRVRAYRKLCTADFRILQLTITHFTVPERTASELTLAGLMTKKTTGHSRINRSSHTDRQSKYGTNPHVGTEIDSSKDTPLNGLPR